MDIISVKGIKKVDYLNVFYSVHSCLVNNESGTKNLNMQFYQNTTK